MSDHPLDDDDPELGEPITSTLKRMQAVQPISDEFTGRLERRIERRKVAADLSRLWWEVPGAVIGELLKGLFSPSARPARRKPVDPPPAPELEGADDG